MVLKLLVTIAVVGTAACGQNQAAPAETTPEVLCAELADADCPQGLDASCVETMDLKASEFPDCEAERNELRRCYFIDLPADAETELAVDPHTCVLSDSCSDETDALCHCERGDLCDVDP